MSERIQSSLDADLREAAKNAEVEGAGTVATGELPKPMLPTCPKHGVCEKCAYERIDG